MLRLKIGKANDGTFYVYDSDGYVYARGFATRAAAKAKADQIKRG